MPDLADLQSRTSIAILVGGTRLVTKLPSVGGSTTT